MRLLLALGALALLAAGCGGGGSSASPADIAQAAKKTSSTGSFEADFVLFDAHGGERGREAVDKRHVIVAGNRDIIGAIEPMLAKSCERATLATLVVQRDAMVTTAQGTALAAR